MARVEQICHREDSSISLLKTNLEWRGGGHEQIYLAEVFAVGGGGRPAVPFIGPGNCTETGTHCCWASSMDKFLVYCARILTRTRNRFQVMNSAILCSLAGRYDNPIPTRYLATIDCLKTPALNVLFFWNFPLQKFLLAWSSWLLRSVTCLL